MIFFFFFFKQKTAYEMRISDWSSDVCSFDLINDSNSLADQYAALLETNPNAEVPVFLNIGDVWEHDLFLSFDVDSAGKEFRLYGGVNNLFNSVSPFLPRGTETGRLTNQNGVPDLKSAEIRVGKGWVRTCRYSLLAVNAQ